jgi:ABC-type phosphonate transport system ATPase subunit
VRVIDRRTDDMLELYELTSLRQAYRRGKPTEWRVVDQRRRDVTRRPVDADLDPV